WAGALGGRWGVGVSFWPAREPMASRPDSAAGLAHPAAVVNARVVQARLQRRLRALALAGGPERGGIGAIRRDGEERLGGGTLQGAKDLHLVAGLLGALEVDRHVALGDERRRLDHVRREGDAVPGDRRHRARSSTGGRLTQPVRLADDAHLALRKGDRDAGLLERVVHGEAE